MLGCGGSGYSNWLRVDNGQISMSRRYEPIQAVQSAERWWAERAGPRLLLFTPQLAHGPMHVPPAELLPEGYEVESGLRERYLAMIGALDTIVGCTFDLLDPRVDLLIVVGDNGTPQQVAPDPERAKTTTFERGVRVPLIVADRASAPDTTTRRCGTSPTSCRRSRRSGAFRSPRTPTAARSRARPRRRSSSPARATSPRSAGT